MWTFSRAFSNEMGEAGRVFDFEHRLLMPDGSIKHRSMRGLPT
jgi:hypothetical protein